LPKKKEEFQLFFVIKTLEFVIEFRKLQISQGTWKPITALNTNKYMKLQLLQNFFT
jgi:hypothetical protein